jgi:hypothetical protein
MKSLLCRLLLVGGMCASAAFAQNEKKATSPPANQASNPSSSSQSPTSAAKCEDLVKLSLPSLAITSATNMPAGRFILPDSSNATHLTNNTIDRTRPLCPYPKIARWNGSASSDDAKNFTCVEAGSAASNRKVKK